MDAVGHMTDWNFLRRPEWEKRFEQMSAYPAMQTAHAIDRAAAANRQMGHVERFRRVVRVLAAQGQ